MTCCAGGVAPGSSCLKKRDSMEAGGLLELPLGTKQLLGLKWTACPVRGLLQVLLLLAAVAAVASADADNSNSARRDAIRRIRTAAHRQEEGKASKGIFPGGQVPFFGDSTTGRAPPSRLPGSWIVQLATPSAAAALAPPTGDTVAVAAVVADPTTDARGRNTTAARAHAQTVDAHISAVADAAGIGGKITQRFTHAMSGFVVSGISFAELQALKADPQVVAVTPNQLAHKRTYSSPWFLGLTSQQGENSDPQLGHSQPQGLWDRLGGVVAPDGAGEDVVVGILDSGLWLEDHPSFADKDYWASSNDLKSQYYTPLKRWKGMCQLDADGTPYPCNNKVIGCRYFLKGYGLENLDLTFDLVGCKDAGGHGTHTAGTAAGNYGAVTPYSPSTSFISGMAPRARLAVYKVLWGVDGSGTWDDIIAGVEQAIIDGVDILSVSLGADNSYDTLSSPDQVAFNNAARAGVFVAIAAGNAGPGLGTASNNALGGIAVAASTLPRHLTGLLQLGSGDVIKGGAVQFSPVGPLPLIYAGNATAAGASVADASLCIAGSLNKALVEGKFVACDRGVNGRGEKADEVKRAGGAAMILMDTPDSLQGVVNEIYSLPVIHITTPDREKLLDYYMHTPSPTALLEVTQVTFDNVAPEMATFSSRGPIPVANGAIMKPDVTAPGVNILAPFTFETTQGYQYLSGTSMATPHVSGVAALLKDAHPHWTPMMIKSALMTTAYTSASDGLPFGTPLDFGAGHINPSPAINPGLVMTSTYTDWQTLMCAAEPVPNDPTCLKLCPSAQEVTQPARQLKAQKVHERGSRRRDDDDEYEYDQGQDKHHAAAQQEEPEAPADRNLARLAASECPTDKVSFDLNGPWVSGNVGGTLVVRRTLTAVCSEDDGRVTFTAVPNASPGSSFAISVWPHSVTLSNGESTTVTIVVKALPTTPMNKYQFGQVVWYSNMGHVVRIPVSVNFRDVLAPAVIAPVADLSTFTYYYGIRTPGPTSVHVLSTPLQAADVVAVDVAPSVDYPIPYGFYDFTVPEIGFDFFAAGLFFGDQPALLDLYLLDGKFNVIAGPTRIDSSGTAFLDASGLTAGNYSVYMEATTYDKPEFVANVNVWRLFYHEAPGPHSLMKVAPNPVPVDSDGMGSLTLNFDGVTMPKPGTWPPTRYLGYVGYRRPESKVVTDTSRVQFFFEPF